MFIQNREWIYLASFNKTATGYYLDLRIMITRIWIVFKTATGEILESVRNFNYQTKFESYPLQGRPVFFGNGIIIITTGKWALQKGAQFDYND